MSDHAASNAFELSRIRAEGWQAARKLLALSADELNPGEADARNPHRAPEARAHWKQGFLEGIGIGALAHGKRRGTPWRRTATSPVSDGGSTRSG